MGLDVVAFYLAQVQPNYLVELHLLAVIKLSICVKLRYNRGDKS